MKKKFVLFLFLLFATFVTAQKNDSISAGWGNLDYNVAESPAFTLLGNSPDNLLKPISVRSIALNIGNYYMANGSAIPKNLGIEISPLLLNSNTTLNDFRKNPFWYRMRISVGSNVLGNGSYQLAEGIRFTIMDETDLRTNDKFLNKLYQSCIDQASATRSAIDEYILLNTNKFNKLKHVSVSQKYDSDTLFKKQIDQMAQKYMVDKLIRVDSINKLRSLAKKALWNARIWELGIATMQQSPDSLISKAKFLKVGLWSTFGSHFSKYDQILIGGSFEMVDSLNSWKPKLSVGTRYYYGQNDTRGFVQVQYIYLNQLNTATASAGIVFNISNGIWGQFSLNFICDFKGNVTLAPGFNIGFGTPEKKAL